MSGEAWLWVRIDFVLLLAFVMFVVVVEGLKPRGPKRRKRWHR